MSEHKIDDIFRKGLQDQDYEVQPEDWDGARKMLGLDKKQKRRGIVFWLGGIAASILVLFGIMGITDFDIWRGNSLSITKEKTELVSTSAIAETDDVKSENVITQSQSLEVKIEHEAGSKTGSIDFKANDEKSNEKLRARNQTFIDNAQRALEKKISRQKKSSLKTNEIRDVTSSQVVIYDEISKPIDGRDIPTVIEKDIEDVEVSAQEQIQSQLVVDQRPHLNQKELEGDLRLSYLISTIPAGDLIPFEIDIPYWDIKTQAPKSTITDTDKKSRPDFGVGAYGGLSINTINPSLGIYGELQWKSNVYANVGVGANYRSISGEHEAEVLDLSTNRGQPSVFNATVMESVVSDLYQVEIPIHIGYRSGRHHVFTGLLFDYPFYTVSVIGGEFILEDINMSLDPPEPDMMGALDQTIVTLEKVVNADSLRKLNTQLRLGYGYGFSNRLRIEILGSYRLGANNEEDFSTPAVSRVIQDTTSPRFTGGLYLRYQFGK